jgi:ABC-2 type transport system permease protein
LTVRLYLHYLALGLRAQLQYRASLVMQIAGMVVVTGVEFLALLALFARFGSIRGWTLPEAALLYGMVEVSYAFSSLLGRGLDSFSRMVVAGDFDRLLLRPRSTLLQLAGEKIALRPIGRFIQAALVLGWAAHALQVHWTVAKVMLLLAALAGGTCLFLGLLVVQATICFWSVEPLEVMHAFTDGGVETGHYPLSIYRPWFRRFFTFVVPLGCVGYLPALAILGRDAGWACWLSPLGGVAFLAAAAQLWRVGVRRYVSTGS